LTKAVHRLQELCARNPADPEPKRHLARAYLNLGIVLRVTDGPGSAQPALEESAGMLYSLGRQFPRRAEFRHELAAALGNLGNLHLNAGRRDEALSLLDEACDLLRKLKADFPDWTLYRTDLANTCNTLAATLAGAGRFNDADRYWAEAQELWEGILRNDPRAASYHGDLGMVLGNRGRLRLLQKKPEQARELLERGIRELLAGMFPNPDHPDFRSALRRQCVDLADVLTRLGEHKAAREQAQAMSQALTHHAAGTYHAVCLLARCVALLRAASASDREIQAHIEIAKTLIANSPHRTGLATLLEDPAFDPLRADPDFINLLRSQQRGSAEQTR
jgi:tetratricopeptide (TPR) repeat protein